MINVCRAGRVYSYSRDTLCTERREAHPAAGGGLALAFDGVEKAARGRFAHADALQVGHLHVLEVRQPARARTAQC